jgi:hypothetical protein
MWTKTVERRIPPPKQRTKPIRQTKKDFNKVFRHWKIKWKELKKENLDGPAKFLYFLMKSQETICKNLTRT